MKMKQVLLIYTTSMIISFVFIFIMCTYLYFKDSILDFEKYIMIMYMFMYFVLGFVTANTYQKNGIARGLCYSVVLYVILSIIKFLAFNEFDINIILLFVMLVSALGSAIGVNVKKILPIESLDI